jgi:hypothetical protein
MVAQFWSGHEHGWGLAAWWVSIAAPLAAAGWVRWWPSRRRKRARMAAETALELRAMADAAMWDTDDQTPDDQTTEVDAMTDQNDGTDEAEALRALLDLVSEGKGAWESTYGGPAMRTYIRQWPDGWVDNLMVGDEHVAYAERVNGNGDPVWQMNGPVTDVVAALRALPEPDAPGAPRAVLPPRDAADRDM